MQDVGALLPSDFTAKVKEGVRHKFEILVGTTWVDLDALIETPSSAGDALYDVALYDAGLYGPAGGYLCLRKSLSVTPSGAGRGPEPITGTWSATFHNPGGVFNPFHPTSAYNDYFRIGREVRISAGLVKGGVTTWFTRLCGFMDEPSINGLEVSVSGTDYMKALTDMKLGSDYASPLVRSRFWGAREPFSSIATAGTGTELYDEGDACEVTTDADNVTPWSVGGSGGAVLSVAGDSSTFALQFTRDAPGPTEQGCQDADVYTLAAGQEYIITFTGSILAGTNYARLIAYETIGGVATYLSSATINYNGGDESLYQFRVKANTASALQLRLSTAGKYATATDAVRIDNISVKTYDPNAWLEGNVYYLDPSCNGVYAVTLDDKFVEHGDADNAGIWKGGWHYDEAANAVRFSPDMVVEAGLDIVVYYFTTHTVDDVVADLLVAGRRYTSRVLALAAMDYTPTGIPILRPWFDEGTDGREALRMLCERANYRFYFAYDGTPTFKPAHALAPTPDFTFTSIGDLVESPLTNDRNAIKNRVTIEGDERTVEPGTNEKPAKWTGEASDATSIGLYGKRDHSIKNQLFQDQESIDAMCPVILAENKDPKIYTKVPVPYCVIPFEVGDSITLQVVITPSLSVEKKAIVNDVSFDLSGTTLNCEISADYTGPVDPPPPPPPPDETGLPDIGSHENQKTAAPPSAAPIPDIGSHENQNGA